LPLQNTNEIPANSRLFAAPAICREASRVETLRAGLAAAADTSKYDHAGQSLRDNACIENQKQILDLLDNTGASIFFISDS